jgi:hypothetical protein
MWDVFALGVDGARFRAGGRGGGESVDFGTDDVDAGHGVREAGFTVAVVVVGGETQLDVLEGAD